MTNPSESERERARELAMAEASAYAEEMSRWRKELFREREVRRYYQSSREGEVGGVNLSEKSDWTVARQSLGRGSPTILLGTSTSVLNQAVAALRSDSRAKSADRYDWLFTWWRYVAVVVLSLNVFVTFVIDPSRRWWHGLLLGALLVTGFLFATKDHERSSHVDR